MSFFILLSFCLAKEQECENSLVGTWQPAKINPAQYFGAILNKFSIKNLAGNADFIIFIFFFLLFFTSSSLLNLNLRSKTKECRGKWCALERKKKKLLIMQNTLNVILPRKVILLSPPTIDKREGGIHWSRKEWRSNWTWIEKILVNGQIGGGEHRELTDLKMFLYFSLTSLKRQEWKKHSCALKKFWELFGIETKDFSYSCKLAKWNIKTSCYYRPWDLKRWGWWWLHTDLNEIFHVRQAET